MQQRIAPSAKEIRTAGDLLAKVPPLSYDWNSKDGQAFLAYVDQLVDSGVPVSWLAASLDLEAGRLHNSLTRYRRSRVA